MSKASRSSPETKAKRPANGNGVGTTFLADAQIPRYQAIASQLNRERDKLSQPARLPPEKQLAEQHQVARDTIRRAMKLLEQHGAVSRTRRRGTFLMPPRATASPGAERSIIFIPPWWMASTTEWLTASIFESTLRWAAQQDAHLHVLHVPRRDMAAAELMEKLRKKRVDGILWCHPSPDQMELLCEISGKLPCVVVGREYPGEQLHAAVPDIAQAVELIDARLVSAGHRQYSVAGTTPLDPFPLQWIRGFQDVYARRGAHFELRHYLDVQIAERSKLPDMLRNFYLPKLLPHVRALVLTASSYLRAIVHDDQLRGMVPAELSLVAFDYGDQPIDTYWPGRTVTHVHCDWSAVGRRATDLLTMLMDGRLDAPRVVREPVRLVEGDTIQSYA